MRLVRCPELLRAARISGQADLRLLQNIKVTLTAASFEMSRRRKHCLWSEGPREKNEKPEELRKPRLLHESSSC